MTDNPAFADLVNLKRRFITLTEQQAAFAKTLPSSTAIIAGEAAFTDEQRAAWQRINTSLGDLAVQIHRHEAFNGLSPVERHKLDTEASKQARLKM